MAKKEKKISSLLCLIFILFIFQSPISKMNLKYVSSIVGVLDELVALILLIYCLLIGKLSKIQYKIFICQLLLFLLGIIGTMVYNLQPFSIVFQDIVTILKFSSTIIGIITISKCLTETDLIFKIQKICSFITIIFIILTVASYVINIPFITKGEMRFGFYSLQLIYYHPAVLAQILVIFLSVFCFNSKLKNKDLLIIFCLIMLCLTLRTKAICFAVIYLVIWKYKYINKYLLLRVMLFFVIIGSVIFLSIDSVNKYYGNFEGSARSKLLVNSIEIAKEKFPIGSGFGTYGTAAAIKNYSPLYHKYGFTNVYGLGYIHTNFATDSFWPAIIAEIGFVGLFLYIYFLLLLFKIGRKMLKKTQECGKISMSLFVYLLICSVSNSAFLNPIAVPYAMIIGLTISLYQKLEVGESQNA